MSPALGSTSVFEALLILVGNNTFWGIFIIISAIERKRTHIVYSDLSSELATDKPADEKITGVIWPDNLKAEYPNELRTHRYRVEKDASISAVNHKGERLTFRDWQSFSDLASGRH